MRGSVCSLVTRLLVLLILLATVGICPGQTTELVSTQAKSLAYRERVDGLLKVVRDADLQKSDQERVVNAIRELGQLKAVEAIDDLIALLTFRRVWPWEKEPKDPRPMPRDGFGPTGTTTARYPASSALAEIGKPALPALVRAIENHDSASLECKNARDTVRGIFHMHGGSADAFFREAAAKASSPAAKQRLLKALETADEDWRSD